MSALSPILRRAEGGLLMFRCPGCQEVHQVRVEGEGRPRWGWNGDAARPTFHPSIRVRGVERLTDDQADAVMRGEVIEPRPFLCHSFVTEGQIQFLGDCTHSLKGQTVPLPVWREAEA